VRAIRRRPPYENAAELGQEFGIGPAMVFKIVRRDRYAWVDAC